MPHIKTMTQNMTWTVREKMHALCLLLLFVLTEAQNVPGGPYDFVGPRKMVEDYRFPVPFGHIYKEGFGDPYLGLKQPLDLLELDLRTPKNAQEAKKLLQKTKKNRILYYRKPDKIMTRDDFLQADGDVGEDRTKIRGNSTDDWPKLQNLAAIQNRNAMTPHPRNTRRDKTKGAVVDESRIAPGDEETPIRELFEKTGLDLTKDLKPENVNWTTCDEFGGKVFFNPRDIVDIEWVPFYVWSLKPIRHAIVHKFSHPTKKLVKKYYDNYHLHLNQTVDWQQPKLLMSGMNKILLIAVNKRGSFVGIHEHYLPPSLKDIPVMIPTVNIRLKIEDPYLLLMFCDDYYATIMAVSGDVPADYKDKIAEAATVGFKGTGRPVWRDMKEEKERQESVRRFELMDEEDKMIKINEEVPPMY